MWQFLRTAVASASVILPVLAKRTEEDALESHLTGSQPWLASNPMANADARGFLAADERHHRKSAKRRYDTYLDAKRRYDTALHALAVAEDRAMKASHALWLAIPLSCHVLAARARIHDRKLPCGWSYLCHTMHVLAARARIHGKACTA